MRIENTDTCIISCSKAVPEKQPQRAPKAEKPRPEAKKARVSAALRHHTGRIFALLSHELGQRQKKVTACITGAAVSAAGMAFLGSYLTLGVNYYCDDKLICTVAASDEAAAIIGSAAKKAAGLGAPEPEIETSAKLAWRSELIDSSEAVDKILAASPYLCRGYIASVNGIDLFVAESLEEVNSALASYVEKYEINDSASLSGEIDVRSRIVRRDEITPSDYITTLLEEGGALTVMNTVDLTEEQTLPHDTAEISDANLYEGETVVETEGSDGRMVIINEQIYSNGELLSSAIISSETTLEPVTEVVRVGTKQRNALVDGLSYPLSGRLSSSFGPRWGRQHRGIDLAVAMNTPVLAAASGTVITAEYRESYGNLEQVDHGCGIITSYAHLDKIGVSAGQKVARGEQLAESGNTGNSTGPHLHFEVISNGEYLNPLDYLK